ncbi:hypothetical protein BDV34DRAFT_216803 [Aspergillus parasiticus]|uniref:Uncharacterized protein n=1 Tax=Aspergillus parasiticus TaxID=5067 RepID=A0A5N6D7E0_ASPPA|nr:hypothetical protein BDV34DRAFT_216803 [Aspergillus parasiticus]
MDSSRSSIITRLFSWRNILSILWLVPAITLLVLNFSGYIIGSGPACRGAACNVDASHVTGSQKTQMFDKGNRNVLGALQLVAKIIEVWFTFIAGGLLFSLAAYLSSRERVPMSLFTLYAEFLDFLYLQDLVKKIWWVVRYRGQYSDDLEMETLTVPMDDMNDRGIKELQVTQTTPVIANTTTIADRPANMAEHQSFMYCFVGFVLLYYLIGGLMGVSTAILAIPSLQYIDINTNNILAFERILGGEKPSGINVYSCTEAALAAGEYNCTSSLYSLAMDIMGDSAMYSITNVFYNDFSLLPPVLQEDEVLFAFNGSAPLRQVLQALSTDYQDWLNGTTSDYTNKAYPDSHRFNQSLDTQLQRDGPAIGVSGWCYETNATQLVSIDIDKHVRCYSGITADDSNDPVSNDYTKCIPWGSGWGNATDYSSSSFTLDQTSSMNIRPRVTGTVLFSSSPQYNEFWNMSRYSQVFEYSMSSVPDFLVWCDTAAYLTFATYTLNPSPISNALNLVQLDWVVYDTTALSLLHLYINAFTTTLIPYETRAILNFSARDEQKQREKQNPFTNSMLTSKATVKMWQFKLRTTTGTVGVVIMVIGTVVTIIQSLLYVFVPESPADLVVTALVHGEMDKKVTGLPMRIGRNTSIFPGTHD